MLCGTTSERKGTRGQKSLPVLVRLTMHLATSVF